MLVVVDVVVVGVVGTEELVFGVGKEEVVEEEDVVVGTVVGRWAGDWPEGRKGHEGSWEWRNEKGREKECDGKHDGCL